MDIRHILVPSDFSDSANHALVHALHIASLHGARVTLLHVVTVYDDDPYNPSLTFPDVQEYYRHLEERAEAQLAETINGHAAKNVPVENVIRRGFSPYEEILAYAAEKQVDLIAMGTHSRKPLARFFLGSVTEKVVHHAGCPVLTVRVEEQPAAAPIYRRILVPTDFSEQAKRALKLAVAFLPQDGSLEIIHVVEDTIIPAYYAAEGGSILDVLPMIRERSLESVAKLVAEVVPAGINQNTAILDGRISQAIVDHAQKINSDLIIMGTHGMNALSQLFVGSQANRVLRKAPCPVITIK